MNDQMASEDPEANGERPVSGRAHTWRLVAVGVGSSLVTALVMFATMSHYAASPSGETAAIAVAPTVQQADSQSSPATSVTQEPQEAGTPSAPPAPIPPPTAATIPVETPVAPTPPPPVEAVMSKDAIEPFLEDGWITVDATLSTHKDVAALHEAPHGFQSYAASFVGTPDDDGCTPEIWVYAVHPSGFVYGGDGYSDCGGGAQAIWSDQTGAWGPLFFTQDMFPCEDLMDAGVPENVGELDCYADEEVWLY